jgi:putative membrane protein
MVQDATTRQDLTDPRVYFAAERTLLAWIRTGLAMMGFGFVVARFGLFLREVAATATGAARPLTSRPSVSLWIGTTLVVLAMIVNLCAAAGYWRTVRRLKQGQPLQFRTLSLGIVVAVLLGVLGLLITLYLLFGLNAGS